MIEPTGYTALDLVGFTDRGIYAANVNYVKNDLVHYGGNIWRILIDDTIGITPAEGTNYTLFIGEPTNLVERIIAPLEDNPATVAYQTGRQIIYNDYLYEVIQDIAIGDVLIAYEDDPTNANIKLASPVVTQILALDTRLTAAEGAIDDIETEMLRDNHILLFGDSWADYTHDTANSRIAEVLINNFSDCTVHNYSYGGTVFDGTNGYDEQLTWMNADTTVDKNRVKAVILVCGVNEYNAGTDANQFRTKLEDWYDKLRLIVTDLDVPVYWFHNYSLKHVSRDTNPTLYKAQFSYYNSIIELLHRPVKACTTFGWVAATHWNTANWEHPNATGSIEYASNMVHVMHGESPTIYPYYETEAYWSGAIADALRQVRLRFELFGSELRVQIRTTGGGLSAVPSGTQLTFPRNLPGILPINTLLDSGVGISATSVSGFTFYVFNPTAKAASGWTTSMSGYIISPYLSVV